MTKLALGMLLTGAIAVSATNVSATLLTANLTADNAFNLYISTDDSVAGTLIGSGNSWGTVYTLNNIALTPGVTNYIHVAASDFGAPAAFIGSFDLSDANFQFDNATQHLVTTPSEWKLSFVGFGTSYEPSISSAGTNGVGPWGFHNGIDASAEWLSFNGSQTNYFSATITSVATPEPTTLGTIGVGALLLLRRKPR